VRSNPARDLALSLCLAVTAVPALAAEAPPPGLTVAFLGDQGLGSGAQAVLALIEDEGADAVLHAGDFDYADDPAAWEAQIDAILGSDFPYFALIGNHDVDSWDGPGGYQDRIEARMNRVGVSWQGDLGIQSTFVWQGLRFVMTSPGVFGFGDPGSVYEDYIRDEFAADDSLWRISSWHTLQRDMQVGGKADQAGWGVYEASRQAGAIIATAHEHTYSRTYLLARCEDPLVASVDEPLVLAADDAGTGPDEGRSFGFVSGLGGQSVRDQELGGAWWASIYTSTQNATHGALFGVFHVNGNPRRAYFYFKDVDGNLIDEFHVESTTGVDDPGAPCSDGIDNDGDGYVDSADPVCTSATWPFEDAACQDGIDNDGDGGMDFDGGASIWGAAQTSPDPQCVGPSGRTESVRACGLGYEAVPVLIGLMSLRRRRAKRRTG
jgi:hypothetical protein